MARKKVEPTILKSQAVRAALEEGIDVPSEGVEYIRQRFGIEITNIMFSAYKSQYRHRRRPLDEEVTAPPAMRPSNEVLSLTLEILKPLVDLHGPNKIRELVDMLAAKRDG